MSVFPHHLIVMSAAVAEPDLAALITYRDYPPEALRRNEQAAVYVEIETNSRGLVVGCELIGFVGSAQLANQVCPIVRRRIIRPAHLPDGAASPARLRTLIRMVIPDAAGWIEIQNVSQPVDLELTVNRLPDGAQVLDTSIVVAIDADGNPTACAAAENASNVSLTNLACRQVMAMKFEKMETSDRTTVAYVTKRAIRFRLDSPIESPASPPAIPQPAS